MNIDKIKLQVEELISDAHVKRDDFPLPLKPLAEHLEYKIELFYPDSKSSDNVSGAVFRDKKVILVNGNDNRLRQRFTIAHEIAHILLHDGSDNGDFIDYRRVDQFDECTRRKENEADEFAACLLMPEKEFVNKWEKFEGNMADLSAYFGTSQPSIGVRAKKLGLDR